MSRRRRLRQRRAIHSNYRHRNGHLDRDSGGAESADADDTAVAPAKPDQQRLLRAQVDFRCWFRP